MDDNERKEFLDAFEEIPTGIMIAFAVMGHFSGIDLTGDRLSGAIVAGRPSSAIGGSGLDIGILQEIKWTGF